MYFYFFFLHRTQYQYGNVDWKLCKPFRIDKAGADLKEYKTNYNAIFKQRLKEEQIKEKLAELEIKMGKETLNSIVNKAFKV